MPALSTLKLPIINIDIWQDTQSQSASLASQMLIDTALATFPENTPLRVLELGSGSGVISILCALSRPLWQITGIEIQPHLCALARQNAAACDISISFEEGDLRTHEGEYDLILANPPWQTPGSGRLSPYSARNLSRIEIACTLADILACIRRCMSPAGTAILLYPQERKAGLICQSSAFFEQKIHQPMQDNRKQYFCATLSRKQDL